MKPISMASNQQPENTSTLLTIPPEIRSAIYEYLIYDDDPEDWSPNTPFWHPFNGFHISKTCKQIQNEIVHLMLMRNKTITFEMICDTNSRHCRSTWDNFEKAFSWGHEHEIQQNVNHSTERIPSPTESVVEKLVQTVRDFTSTLSNEGHETFASKALNLRTCSCFFPHTDMLFDALPEMNSYEIAVNTCRFVGDPIKGDGYGCPCNPSLELYDSPWSCTADHTGVLLKTYFTSNSFLQKMRKTGWEIDWDANALNLTEGRVTTWHARRIPWVPVRPGVGL